MPDVSEPDHVLDAPELIHLAETCSASFNIDGSMDRSMRNATCCSSSRS
jgi:hypothetical protein